MPVATEIHIQHDAPIPTWFGIGGRADRLAHAQSVDDLRRCLEIDPNLRVLGDGANLLVDDAGVGFLVLRLDGGELADVRFDPDEPRLVAGAGVNLPKLILECVRRGLAGLEGLGGIPATIGGAAIMNAGGTFGTFADAVACVHALTRAGTPITLERPSCDFAYRHSALRDVLVTSVELRLRRDDPDRLRAKLKSVMSAKSRSQPLGDNSAGCVFKNPTLRIGIPEIGVPGARVSAGLLIDRAGCKGARVGGARVSERHGNFFVTTRKATARDVTELMDQVRARVREAFDILLEPEVVIWKRDAA
ncbi:MAG TPA: UDP-N-acetylmuramate dehydrogenase [Phycisphaerales bacterium]|nr:UDP-N-acetylmuramate dehydrogenase [Phycisphaerales bacterium]